jgi:hypothetical protein
MSNDIFVRKRLTSDGNVVESGWCKGLIRDGDVHISQSGEPRWKSGFSESLPRTFESASDEAIFRGVVINGFSGDTGNEEDAECSDRDRRRLNTK